MRTHYPRPTALTSNGHGGRDTVHLVCMSSSFRSVRGIKRVMLFARQVSVRRRGFLSCIRAILYDGVIRRACLAAARDSAYYPPE